jgi:TolA-binding protein
MRKHAVLAGAPIGLALLLASAMAWAQAGGAAATGSGAAAPKYTRKTKDINVKSTELTQKLVPKDEKKPAGPDPNITADKFIQILGQIQGDVDDLIATYKDQLRDMEPNTDRHLEYSYRLADAYGQKERYHHSLAMDALNKAEKAKTPAEKQGYLEESKRQTAQKQGALVNAIKAFEGVRRNPRLPNFKKADEAIFYYAFTLQQANRIPEAEEIYKLLLKDYQGSRFVPDAYFFFGDRYFERRELGNAEVFYSKVIELKNKTSLYPLAVYKRGWVYYNQKRLGDSANAFRESISITNGSKQYASINQAAKKDFVRVYAEGDQPVNTAYRAFQALDRTEYSFKMYNLLGDYYMDEGKGEKAIYVFHDMMKMRPQDPLLCEWQENVTRATMSIGGNADKIRELSNLVKLYTALKNSKTIPEQNLQECREKAAGTTGELAGLWHLEGLKTLQQPTLDNAQALYHVYLDHFPDASNFLDMQVNYAELLWSLAAMEKDPRKAPSRWEATAREHCKIAELPTVADAQRKDSAFACVLAFKNEYAVDPSTEIDDKNDDPNAVAAPENIPENEQKMMEAFKRYLTYVKDEKDNERVQILFFTGRIYWKHKHFDECVTYMGEVVEKHPEHEVGEYAAQVLLNCLDRAHKGGELVDWVNRMLANKKLIDAHPRLKDDFSRIANNAKKVVAKGYEAQGNYRECARHYDEIQRQNPNDPEMNQLLFNAALCYRKAHMLGYAIRFREQLINRPGAEKDTNAQQAQLFLGDDYQAIARYDKAAEMYEKYAERFAGEKDAPKALFYAQFYRLGLGDDAQAIKDIDLYAKDFARKEPHEAANAEFSVAEIYAKNKETDKFIAYLENYIRQWGQKGGVDKEIEAHVRAGEALWKLSCPVKGEYGACLSVSRDRALRTQSDKSKKKKVAQTQEQCGETSKNKITLSERKPTEMHRAQEHFNRALALWRKGESLKEITGKDEADVSSRKAKAVYYVAAAQFYLAEGKYEHFLSLKFPTGLNFNSPSRSKDSLKRFAKWMEDKQNAGAAVNKQYQGIVDLATTGGMVNAAHWAIAAAAREGQVFQNFSDALFTAEIPKDVRADQESMDVYCDTLTDKANPLEQKSIDAFSFCLDNSNKLNWFNEWSHLCEAELAQIKPQDFPAAGEIRALPDNVANVVDSQTILSQVESNAAPQIDPSQLKTSPGTTAPGAAPPANDNKKKDPKDKAGKGRGK